jgi:hypothetical protein
VPGLSALRLLVLAKQKNPTEKLPAGHRAGRWIVFGCILQPVSACVYPATGSAMRPDCRLVLAVDASAAGTSSRPVASDYLAGTSRRPTRCIAQGEDCQIF